MKPHKHAEVLRAIADGKEVQYSNFEDYWCVPYGSGFNPIDNHDFQWRIKPEPKPDVVRYMTITAHSYGALSAERHTIDNLRLTFDSETGKLKSAEVL